MEQIRSYEKEMAEQLAGFKTLGTFRKYSYQAVAVCAFITGAVTYSQEGAKQAVIMAFVVLIGGIAAARLLTAPFGAVMWFRNWVCPRCHKRLGMRPSESCPHCSARLFSFEEEAPK